MLNVSGLSVSHRIATVTVALTALIFSISALADVPTRDDLRGQARPAGAERS